MTMQAVTWALGRAPSLAQQAILFSLANHADDWGVTYVGQESIAAECSCRRATVTDNLKRLEEAGLIARVGRRNGLGHRTSDHIVLAPLAADRGQMHDADKRAREKHPPEVCDLARSQDTPSVHGQNESLSTPHESLCTLDTPPKYARRARTQREPKEEPTGAACARARGEASLPLDDEGEQRERELIAWHGRVVLENGGRPPRASEPERRAARKLLALAGDEPRAISRRMEFALGRPFWASKVLKLSDLYKHWPKLSVELRAAEVAARRRPAREQPVDEATWKAGLSERYE